MSINYFVLTNGNICRTIEHYRQHTGLFNTRFGFQHQVIIYILDKSEIVKPLITSMFGIGTSPIQI